MWVSRLYLLDILRKKFGDNKIGLYLDDGLIYFQNLSGPESEKIKKKLCKIFKNHGLNITVDVTYELQTSQMSSLIYKLESTTHTGKSTVRYIFTSNQTTRHLSPSNFLPWSVKEYLIFHVIKRLLIKLPLTPITLLKTAVSTKTSNSHHNFLKEENAADTFYGLICHLAPTWRPTLAKYFCDS